MESVMADNTKVLPDFADPPVNETALSIQFVPILGFGVPHYGLYWLKVRHEFSKFQVLPELPSATEQFDESPRSQPGVAFQLVTQPEVRCWFIDETGNRLVQVQRDRLVHNWRKVEGTEKYPRYPSVRKSLEVEWARFCEFLTSEKLGTPQVNQCEVTYVNYIEYDKDWKGYGELNKVIAFWSGKGTDNFLPSAERINIEAHYVLPNKLGRLHIAMLPVIRGRDSKEILQLTLTARGAPKSSNPEDIFHWLDLGREWVVKGFADFTSKSMHNIWGRKL